MDAIVDTDAGQRYNIKPAYFSPDAEKNPGPAEALSCLALAIGHTRADAVVSFPGIGKSYRITVRRSKEPKVRLL